MFSYHKVQIWNWSLECYFERSTFNRPMSVRRCDSHPFSFQSIYSISFSLFSIILSFLWSSWIVSVFTSFCFRYHWYRKFTLFVSLNPIFKPIKNCGNDNHPTEFRTCFFLLDDFYLRQSTSVFVSMSSKTFDFIYLIKQVIMPIISKPLT